MKKSESERHNHYSGVIYVFLIWFVSRLLIVIAMQFIAPQLALTPANVPPDIYEFKPIPGWELFAHWDGFWYRTIATEGYEFVNDGTGHNVAFFPLYPLLVRIVLAMGLPFAVAGTLVSNIAFLAALWVLYQWVNELHGLQVARWTVASLALAPYSLFCTMTYTEGLFLLCTTASLWSFEQRQYVRAGFWGILATATRLPGIALVPTFLLVAWRENRPKVAYVTGFAVSSGLILFSLYSGQWEVLGGLAG